MKASTLMPPSEAFGIMMDSLPEPRKTDMSPAEALGLAVCGEVRAPQDYPAFDRVIRDGYAVRSADTPGTLRILEGESSPGVPFTGRVQAGQAVYVLTGAPLPEGADAVVRVEDVTVEGSFLTVPAVRPSAAVVRAGSEKKAGEVVLGDGDVVTPLVVGALQFMGIERVRVYAPPRAAVVVTGDELTDRPGTYTIRDGDGPLVKAMLEMAGIRDVVVRRSEDDFDNLLRLLNKFKDRDLVIFTGAVSMGRKDVVPQVLEAAGGRKIFHRIAQKPGRPMLFGRIGDSLFFGLPGNPLSCLVGMHFYVLPAVRRLMGLPWMPASVRTVLSADAVSDTDRVTRLLVRIDEATGTVQTLPWRGSADVFNTLGASGYISLGPRQHLRAGSVVMAEPFGRWVHPADDIGAQSDVRSSDRAPSPELHMIDVGSKDITRRMARAYARVEMSPDTARAISEGHTPKGDVLRTAEVAGIMGAKKTPDLVPLCHPLVLDGVDVKARVEGSGVSIWTQVRCTGRTGVEMEALTAASAAALTVYDMIKGMDRAAVIREVLLVEKDGGKSGHFTRKFNDYR